MVKVWNWQQVRRPSLLRRIHASAASPRIAGQLGEPSEKEKMLAGELFFGGDGELWRERVAARKLLKKFNQELAYDNVKGRRALLKELLGALEPEEPPFIEPQFFCDYGYNIFLGRGVFINMNCTFLDCAPIRIGNRVVVGPGTSIFTVSHMLECDDRQGVLGPQRAAPVTICNDVWVGGAATICPGVTVGEGSTVAAGAVVTADVEPFSLVGGNPARLIRHLGRTAGAGGSMGQR